eukprot:CAMPEP_0194335832 /NCGR_PEP_ID=MMETSP0171-20130528/70875_1 /TAXON_ID=218684 /ORGANISM="Corethron pennatum, Strain L29A3" /LENGTH=215 /DNA_ID=CAMNT_0039099059 /DNA_START=9 /DNA_END=653 /DNA_ORIENTATION=-
MEMAITEQRRTNPEVFRSTAAVFAIKKTCSDSSGPTSIFISRHAERLDRAMEKEGLSWLNTAVRPQDPPLSSHGCTQARLLGAHLAVHPHGKLISRVVCSPLVRCVQTADAVAAALGLGPRSILVEPGACEEAKSFRRARQPYLQDAASLFGVTDRIDVRYVPVRPVEHVLVPEVSVRPGPEDHGMVELHRNPEFSVDVLKARAAEVEREASEGA